MLYFIVFIFFLRVSSLHGEVYYEDVDSSCMWFKGIQRGASGQVIYQFVNGCGEKRHMTVCFRDGEGNWMFRSTSRRVPSGGRYTVYTPPFTFRPSAVWIDSDPDTSYAPGPCYQEYSEERESLWNMSE